MVETLLPPSSAEIKQYGGFCKTLKNDHFQTGTWSFFFLQFVYNKNVQTLCNISPLKKKKKSFFFLQWLYGFSYINLRKLLLWWCYVSILIIWIHSIFPEKLILLINLNIHGNYIMGQKKCKVSYIVFLFFFFLGGGGVNWKTRPHIQCNPIKIIYLLI